MTRTQSHIGIVEKLKRTEPYGLFARGPRLPDKLVNPDGPEAAAIITEMVEALETISSQAICYGMRADETELRDWLKRISEIAEATLVKVRGK